MSAVLSPRKRKMSTSPDEGKKPATDESPRIYVKIKGLEDGNLLMFRTEMRTPLEKLMTAYSNWVSINVNENRFFFNGREISAEDTPDELGMGDEAEIHALRCQCEGTVHIKKPKSDDSPRIIVKIRDLTGKETPFRIKKETMITRLLESYCHREGLAVPGLRRFIYNGRVLQTDTHLSPAELGMEDGDVIHSVLHLTGS